MHRVDHVVIAADCLVERHVVDGTGVEQLCVLTMVVDFCIFIKKLK